MLSSCDDGGVPLLLDGLADGPVPGSEGVVGAADIDADVDAADVDAPLSPLLLLLGVDNQSLSLTLLGDWTPPSSRIFQFPVLAVSVAILALSSSASFAPAPPY